MKYCHLCTFIILLPCMSFFVLQLLITLWYFQLFFRSKKFIQFTWYWRIGKSKWCPLSIVIILLLSLDHRNRIISTRYRAVGLSKWCPVLKVIILLLSLDHKYFVISTRYSTVGSSKWCPVLKVIILLFRLDHRSLILSPWYRTVGSSECLSTEYSHNN